jgi:L-fuculokinase
VTPTVPLARDALIAVLDIGKTNAKLTIAEAASGAEIWSRSAPNRVLAGPPYRHHDISALQVFFQTGLAEAPGRARIACLVPVAHGAAGALIAGDALALPVMDYEDPALEEIAADYAAERPEFSETLSPALPLGLNLGRQFFFQERRCAEGFARATALLPYAQFWSFWLSGVAASEITSLGSHTDLWQPRKGCPSSLARRRFWDRKLAPLRRADDVLGTLRPELARATGLSETCRVLAGIHDSNASYLQHRLAHGVGKFAVLSTGTWVVAMAAGADPARLGVVPDTLANLDAFGEIVPTVRFMGGREYATLAPEGTVADVCPSLVGALLARGIRALPSFAPAGPFTGMAGCVQGAPGGLDNLSAAERHALASLYCALMSDACLDILGHADEVVIEGPFAGNALFCMLLAGLRPGARIAAAQNRGGTLGGARLLALGLPPEAGASSDAVAPWADPALIRERALWRAALPPSWAPPFWAPPFWATTMGGSLSGE